MSKIFLVIGLLGQTLFCCRFLIQWIYSEFKKQSVIPPIFWYLSISGSLLLLAYSIFKKDIVFFLGYFFNTFIYMRNISLIKAKRRNETE
ncbi:MAG: hypothetical protein DKM50_04440 [Candidatus Margulisiibacteriota bacterium]|nr:MAG: hypothetical protein A2X43_05580 [Candidatus Margulisbacteria bacterium GWD2_39_127]OGI01025.1 MAG: hypothetical protein A2X42_12220 [Candidatus Margulisbacteria bacterium GWF2_38_17]OGI09554.1 MAG: hypothetical protein A2X41_06425 [Candidatus Margulisbacteria bacterium GWE2_39_32]PZM81999.1 MAG: hypothetical protein DKM50_04440 [Candidatus Margulisiibacteriota bacterium]HCT85109.1 hypothetical protein [Candidatus Margulisiibacteriota bacterium]